MSYIPPSTSSGLTVQQHDGDAFIGALPTQRTSSRINPMPSTSAKVNNTAQTVNQTARTSCALSTLPSDAPDEMREVFVEWFASGGDDVAFAHMTASDPPKD